MRDRLIEWGIPADRIEVIRNFTDLTPGNAEPGTTGLYLGRLSAEKGLDVLLHALAEAGDPPFHFVGDGPAGPELEGLGGDSSDSRALDSSACSIGRMSSESCAARASWRSRPSGTRTRRSQHSKR